MSVLAFSKRSAMLRVRHFRRMLIDVYVSLGFFDDATKCCRAITATRVPNLVRAAERLHLTVFTDANLPVDGLIGSARQGGRAIVLRHAPVQPRARFTLAHEIAHELVRLDRLYPVDAEGHRVHATMPQEEGFCDFVAGLLLMPLPLFVPEIDRLVRLFPDVGLAEYVHVARQFSVSLQSMLFQIAVLNRFKFAFELEPIVGATAHERADSALIAYSAGWPFPWQLKEDLKFLELRSTINRYRWTLLSGEESALPMRVVINVGAHGTKHVPKEIVLERSMRSCAGGNQPQLLQHHLSTVV
jgi:Zn-dependent peptidase ImmA (M78 family)